MATRSPSRYPAPNVDAAPRPATSRIRERTADLVVLERGLEPAPGDTDGAAIGLDADERERLHTLAIELGRAVDA